MCCIFSLATENRLSFSSATFNKGNWIFTNTCFPLENILIIVHSATKSTHTLWLFYNRTFHYGVNWLLQLSESFSILLLFAPTRITKFEFERESEMNSSICSQMMPPSWKRPASVRYQAVCKFLYVKLNKENISSFSTITLYKAVLCHLFSLFDSHRDFIVRPSELCYALTIREIFYFSQIILKCFVRWENEDVRYPSIHV